MTDSRLYLANQLIQPLQPATVSRSGSVRNGTAPAGEFEQALNQAIGGGKFSQHAAQRLQTRNINMTPAQMDQLKGAVDKAAQKGARESLILMNNDLALVVSVRNRTVITAMDGASIKDNVFTNIDSAVIV